MLDMPVKDAADVERAFPETVGVWLQKLDS